MKRVSEVMMGLILGPGRREYRPRRQLYLYGPVDYPGAFITNARGINDRPVGDSWSEGSGFHGFSLTGTTFTPVDYPGAGFNVNGINDRGTIVGTYFGNRPHGFY